MTEHAIVERPRRGPVSRRTLTVIAAGLLALALGVIGVTLPVPYVALGPGPTFDTLGEVDGTEVVAVDGLTEYPTSGNLNMTTVAVTDRLSLFAMLGFWISGDRQVVPREDVFPPELTEEQVQEQNTQAFTASEANAEVAALAELELPTRAVVDELVPDSAAVGVLEPGDEIVAVSGVGVDDPLGVAMSLTETVPGDTVTITYRRGGEQRDVDVVLGENPSGPQGLLGVRPGIAPVGGEIAISLGDIGGPSAGLMFALALVDKLTPGELTGGRFVAGTGSITLDGRVEPIGGIEFKMRKAHEVGATVFLVPAANCAEALANPQDGLQLVRVTTLDDAIAGLEALNDRQPAPSCAAG